MMSTAAPAKMGAAAQRPARPGGLKRAEARFGLALVALPLVAFAAVILYPFVNSLRLAFYRYTLMTPQPIFDGLANFARLVEDGEIVGV